MARKEVLFHSHVYTLSYELVNPNLSQTILILHGWGSNKAIMKQAFAKTFPNFTHLYLDLPGFGHSNIHDVIDTTAYAQIVECFLKALHVKPLMIIGHSYGGKVATLLRPPILVLLSTAGIVVPKSFKIRAKIALFKLFKPLFPKTFYRFFASKDVEGMSDTMYGIFKRVVNEDLSDTFASIKAKTLIFWGKDDTATPLSSGQKIHDLVPRSLFYPMEGDHFFFVKNASLIEKFILESIG